MTASTRRELRSAATSTSTTAIGLIRVLTDARPIKPTSTRCLSARRPNPAEAPLIDAEILFRQPQPPHCTYYPVANEFDPWGGPVWDDKPVTRCFFAPMNSS